MSMSLKEGGMTAIAIARIAADNYKRHLTGRQQTDEPGRDPIFFLRRAFAEYKFPLGRPRRNATAELTIILAEAKPQYPFPLP